ncbi:hypothetical protein [Bacillus cereus]|uniref:hypothetical protein n=1 Tax=Bacillus cereus TaxID=1396 RepID=UPI000994F5FA|nr:hypothetical protein [Bacillus cereus]OPA18220.1 hypothetical protein BHL54_03075 [Bacillus cereus]
MINNIQLDPKTQQIIAQRLWPTMLFLVVMSLSTGLAGYWWTASFKNQIHSIIAFYVWFFACLIVLLYGCIAFYKDAKLQTRTIIPASQDSNPN